MAPSGLGASLLGPRHVLPPVDDRPCQGHHQDDGSACIQVDAVCYHTPSYQAGADEHPDERLKHLALVMHARIAGTHETPELRILPVQCLLDLLELTLLMLRERHDASPTT
jgi:hypothetical protein